MKTTMLVLAALIAIALLGAPVIGPFATADKAIAHEVEKSL